MKKYYLLTMLLAFFATTLSAQTGYEMVIEKIDGTKIRINTSEVKHSYFQKLEIDASNAVDLGLPSGKKWANMNIGASTETDYGTYFAWGETTGYTVLGHNNLPAAGNTKTEFSWSTYKWCDGTSDVFTKYVPGGYSGSVDYRTVLERSDDAAFTNWGAPWRMPTKEEFEELLANTTTEYVSNYNNTGVNGYKLTGSNGNYIFLPNAGYINEYGVNGGYSYSYLNEGYYWASTTQETIFADNLFFYSLNIEGLTYYRYCGMPIRAIWDDNNNTGTDAKEKLAGTWTLTSCEDPDTPVGSTFTFNSNGTGVWTYQWYSDTFNYTFDSNGNFTKVNADGTTSTGYLDVVNNVASGYFTYSGSTKQYSITLKKQSGNDNPEPAGEFQGPQRVFGENQLKSYTFDDKTVTFHYNNNGYVTQIDRVNSSTGTSKTYTISYGDQISVNCSNGDQWTATLESHGFIGKLSHIDGDGRSVNVSFTYNEDDQLTAVDYGDGDVFTLTYSDGNIVSMTNFDKTITYGYDSSTQGRIQNQGHVMEFDNIYGIDMDDFNLLYYIGGLGKSTIDLPMSGNISGYTITGTWTVDNSNRATRGEFSSHTLTWDWDGSNNTGTDAKEKLTGTWTLTSCDDPDTPVGMTFTFNSDGTGTCTYQWYSDTFSYTFDSNGNFTKINADGTTSTGNLNITDGVASGSYSYSGSSWEQYSITLTKQSGNDNPEPAGEFQGPKRVFGENQLKSYTFDDKKITFHYDANGLVTQIDRINTSTWSEKTYTISYGDQISVNCSNGDQWTATLESHGFIGKLTYIDGDGEAEQVTFTYNDNDQLTAVDYGDGDVFTLTYSDGNIVSMTNFDKTITYGYDSSTQGRIQNLGHVMEFDHIYGIDMDDFNLLYYIGGLGKSTNDLPMSGTISGYTMTGTWTIDNANRATRGEFSDHTLTWDWDGQGSGANSGISGNNPIIGIWEIVSGTYKRYENNELVKDDVQSLTSPYDRVEFFADGTFKYYVYSHSTDSYREDGTASYSMDGTAFVYGNGDWEKFEIVSFNGTD